MSNDHRESLWKFYYEKLAKAVDIGWNDGFEIDDQPLVEKLKSSIAEFSAFKETSFKKAVEDLLTTEEGKLRTKNDFMKEAMKVSDDYNVRWLETEYHQTIANANMAAKWKSFEENISLYPNVKLVTVGDKRVRPEHKVLDGTIRPYNDPFWKDHIPPLDWGCRCNVIQTDEEPNEVPGGFQTKIEFENNPAETGTALKGDAYKQGLTKAEIKEAKENAEKWSEVIDYKTITTVKELEKTYAQQNINIMKENIIMDTSNNSGYVRTINSWELNKKLRYNLDLTDDDKNVISALDELISKNTLKDNYKMTRYTLSDFVSNVFKIDISNLTNAEAIIKLKETKINTYSDKGFTSISAIEHLNVMQNRRIKLIMKIKKGTNAFLTKNYSESEFILGRDQKFIITDITESGKQIILTLES